MAKKRNKKFNYSFSVLFPKNEFKKKHKFEFLILLLYNEKRKQEHYRTLNIHYTQKS